jgi:hypothetical protein
MSKSVPIRTDVFRFITIRTPEHLEIANKNLRFVVHPDISTSRIKSCPLPPPDKGSAPEVFQSYLNTFSPLKTYKDVRALNTKLYDAMSSSVKKKLTIKETYRALAGAGQSTDSVSLSAVGSPSMEFKVVISLFDTLFYQVITSQDNYVRQACSQMLIANHILKNGEAFDSLGMTKLTDIKIEIPSQVFDCVRPWRYKECGGELNGIQNLGIADFRRVEQEVCCYVPGEVSHIENVMAKEYKERSTRNYVRTENTIETSRETEVENLTDVTTSTRNEISTEVASVLESDKSANYGGSLGVSGTWGGATINVNAYADFANSNSSSYSNTEAKTYAEEVTRRALERIVQKTSEKRTSKIIKEFEENNKHGFDNRLGDKHVTGIYRWIDIIYKNRLVNYGKRLMVEFMLPEPSEFYKRMLKYVPADGDAENTDVPQPPKKLEEFQITKSDDITLANINVAASYYGVPVAALPTSQITLTKDLSPLAPVDHNRNINTQSLIGITIPPEYEADTIVGSYTYEYRAGSATSSQQAFCDFTFGGKIVSSGRHYSGSRKNETVNINLDFVPNLAGTVPVSVAYSGCFGFYGAASIQCILKASVIKDWQSDAYNKMLAAYNKMLDEYNRKLDEIEQANQANETAAGEKHVNPAMNRIVEQRELKRMCIEMLMKPFCKIQGMNNIKDINACALYDIPQVNQTAAFAEYTRVVKFFEQAIDWQIMSYLFYPYYWADKCDWAELMQSENEDMVFQAFLQSGMARVVVPIRQQFTEAFAYYLKTGDIWLGNDLVAGADNDLYLSIAEEMQTIEGTVEEEWETRVPTTLAIIQGKSAYLEQEGLPCCHLSEIIDGEEVTSGILPSGDTLQIINP